MRKFINVVVESLTPITVYHGSSGQLSGDIRIPFFTTTSEIMARSYANEKGRDGGRLWAFDLSPTAKIANYEELEALADHLRIDWEGAHPSDLLCNDGDYDDYEIIHELRQRGYDAVLIHDFGHHDDFAEEPTYVVLNSAILSHPREVERIHDDI